MSAKHSPLRATGDVSEQLHAYVCSFQRTYCRRKPHAKDRTLSVQRNLPINRRITTRERWRTRFEKDCAGCSCLHRVCVCVVFRFFLSVGLFFAWRKHYSREYFLAKVRMAPHLLREGWSIEAVATWDDLCAQLERMYLSALEPSSSPAELQGKRQETPPG